MNHQCSICNRDLTEEPHWYIADNDKPIGKNNWLCAYCKVDEFRFHPLISQFTRVHDGTTREGDLYLDIRDRKHPLKPLEEHHFNADVKHMMCSIFRFTHPKPNTII